MPERLQKLIANAGYGSRRWAERIIEQGRITLNNQQAKLGDKATITRSEEHTSELQSRRKLV